MDVLKILAAANLLSIERGKTGLLKIGIQFGVSDADLVQLVKKGWWNILFIGKDLFSHYGLRMLPDVPTNQWPVVKIYDFNRAVTFAPNLAAFLPFLRVIPFLENVDMLQKLESDWLNYKDYAQPFYTLMENEEQAEQMHAFILDEITNSGKNISNNNKEERYIRIWQLYSSEEPSFTDLIMRMKAFRSGQYENGLQSFRLSEHSVWASKAAHVMALSASRISPDIIQKHYREQLLWALLNIQPVDITNANMKILPDTAVECYMDYLTKLSLWPAFFPKTSEAKGDTLWYIYEQLESKGKNKYAGTAHLEAAALFETAYSNPSLSWNMLTLAAYWAGKNLPEMMEPVRNAAKYLADKNQWESISEFLSFQYK